MQTRATYRLIAFDSADPKILSVEMTTRTSKNIMLPDKYDSRSSRN